MWKMINLLLEKGSIFTLQREKYALLPGKGVFVRAITASSAHVV